MRADNTFFTESSNSNNWQLIEGLLKQSDLLMPEPTLTYEPISHFELLETIEKYNPFPLVKENACLRLSRDLSNIALTIPLDKEVTGYKPLLYLANGHTKSRAIKLQIGLFVMKCSNGLWMQKEGTMFRFRHTFNRVSSLSNYLETHLTDNAITDKVFHYEMLLNFPLTDDETRLLILDGFYKYKLYPCGIIKDILKERDSQFNDVLNPFYVGMNDYTAFHLLMALTAVFRDLKTINQYQTSMNHLKLFSKFLEPKDLKVIEQIGE